MPAEVLAAEVELLFVATEAWYMWVEQLNMEASLAQEPRF